MAGDSQKKLIQSNNRIFRIWVVIGLVVTSFSAFMIFYVKRGDPKKQNTATFYSGLACSLLGYVMTFNSIRVRKEGNKYVTGGNLAGRNTHLLDVIGVGLIVQFIGIWWDKAAYFFLLIPAFIVYTFVKKVLNWLHAF